MKLFMRFFPKAVNKNITLYNVFTVILCAILFFSFFFIMSSIAFFILPLVAGLSGKEIGGAGLIVMLPFSILAVDIVLCLVLLVTNVRLMDQ
ncbi:MAG: hypothetical protein AABZ39_04990 [Spirochaetota bacterium]